jgi:hypothetical protein
VRTSVRIVAGIAALWCMAPPAARAQTQSVYSNLANPAIGMNALFSGQGAPNLDQPYGLRFDEAELSLLSVVDPFWTLSGNIVFAPDGVDPEEIWARSTNVPSISLKVGKLRGTFGKHGLLHTHAFPFIEAPLIMANSIGAEGFKDAGLEAAWLTPLPWYAELTGGLYQALPAGPDQPLDFGSASHGNLPYLGHFKNQFDLSDATTAELGFSALQGQGADGRTHGAYGADLTFRNVPPRMSNRRGWTLMSEYIQSGSSGDGSYRRQSDGWYASLQYRLSQIWWAGLRGEQARDSFADFVVDGAGGAIPADVTRASANVAWTPSEFSFIRLEYSHAHAGSGVHPSDDRIMLQMSYTIGYHPAHAY